MFDGGKNHVITIDFFISLCYYIRSSKYVVILIIYKEFFSLEDLFVYLNHSKLPLARRLAKRNRLL